MAIVLSVSRLHLKALGSLLRIPARWVQNLGMRSAGSWFRDRLVNTLTIGILMSLSLRLE